MREIFLARIFFNLIWSMLFYPYSRFEFLVLFAKVRSLISHDFSKFPLKIWNFHWKILENWRRKLFIFEKMFQHPNNLVFINVPHELHHFDSLRWWITNYSMSSCAFEERNLKLKKKFSLISLRNFVKKKQAIWDYKKYLKFTQQWSEMSENLRKKFVSKISLNWTEEENKKFESETRTKKKKNKTFTEFCG